MHSFEKCRQALRQGEFEKALEILHSNPELKEKPRYRFYMAMSAQVVETTVWESVVESLEWDTIERLHACQMVARLYREAKDHTQERKWLKIGAETAKSMREWRTAIEIEAALASRLLNDGKKLNGIEKLQDAFQHAVERKEDNLIVALGAILGGIFMSDGNWSQATAISVSMEAAAKQRENWIGFACGRMMRASCRFHMGHDAEAVGLLFETGNALTKMGAVAALNCIKARLIEFKLQIGDERFEYLCRRHLS